MAFALTGALRLIAWAFARRGSNHSRPPGPWARSQGVSRSQQNAFPLPLVETEQGIRLRLRPDVPPAGREAAGGSWNITPRKEGYHESCHRHIAPFRSRSICRVGYPAMRRGCERQTRHQNRRSYEDLRRFPGKAKGTASVCHRKGENPRRDARDRFKHVHEPFAKIGSVDPSSPVCRHSISGSIVLQAKPGPWAFRAAHRPWQQLSRCPGGPADRGPALILGVDRPMEHDPHDGLHLRRPTSPAAHIARGRHRPRSLQGPKAHTSGTSTSRLPTWFAAETTPCSSICSTRRAALL